VEWALRPELMRQMKEQLKQLQKEKVQHPNP
jgi:hypothetical protein